MARKVMAGNGARNIEMPNGRVLSPGDTTVLTDSQWALVSGNPNLIDKGATSSAPETMKGSAVASVPVIDPSTVPGSAGGGGFVLSQVGVVSLADPAFGAVEGGITDCTAAINAAIAAAAALPTGGIVYAPPGRWRSTGLHNIPANVSIQGAGPDLTTFVHRGIGTYLFRVGSTTDGPNPQSYDGPIRDFTIEGGSAGDGTGSWGQQIGIVVLNCLYWYLERIHCRVIYQGFLIDGGDEVALGAKTFTGNGYMTHCTVQNVYRGFQILRWVTSCQFNHIYGYGNSPKATGSTGLQIDGKFSTSTLVSPSFEGWDVGYSIGTTHSGVVILNPRVENCNAELSWTGNNSGITVIGGNQLTQWQGGASAGQNTLISGDGIFPTVASLPPASAQWRRALLRLEPGNGVKDSLNLCIQQANGGYAWIDLTNQTSGGGSSNTSTLSTQWDWPMTLDPRSGASSNSALTANNVYYYRVTGGGGSVSSILLHVGTADAANTVQVGVHANIGTGRAARPGVRTATGSATITSGDLTIPLDSSVTVQPGDWFSISTASVTATFLRGAPQTTTILTDGMAHYQSGGGPTIPSMPGTLFSQLQTVCMVGGA